MKRSSSQEVVLSLKRVKISTSPGELRLDRDIESLLAGKHWRWTSNTNNDGSSGNFNSYASNANNSINTGVGGSSFSNFWSNSCLACVSCPSPNAARLIRDPVDALRLKLIYFYRPTNPLNHVNYDSASQQHHSSIHHSARPNNCPPMERWTYLIQMPRMYPHLPPTITRVSREILPNNNENIAPSMNANQGHGFGFGNFGSINSVFGFSQPPAPTAAIVASSVMQRCHAEPPVPERVLIRSLPPMWPSSSSSFSSSVESVRPEPQAACESTAQEIEFSGDKQLLHHHNHHASSQRQQHDYCDSEDDSQRFSFKIDESTSIYNKWSPVSSLGDLLHFLMDIPSKRREWWGVPENRRGHLEQMQHFHQRKYHSHQSQKNGFLGNSTTPVGHPTIAPGAPSSEKGENESMMGDSSKSSDVMFVGSPQRTLSNHSPYSAHTTHGIHSHQTPQKPHSYNYSHHNHNHDPPQDQHHHNHFPSSPCDMDVEDGVSKMNQILSPEKLSNPFTPNRFDVGYDRGVFGSYGRGRCLW